MTKYGTVMSLEFECCISNSSKSQKRFNERSSKIYRLDLCQGLEKLLYKNVGSPTIQELSQVASEPP